MTARLLEPLAGVRATAPAGRAAPRRALLLLIGATLLLPLLVYRDTADSIVAIWGRSETYAHGFVIVPITLWLAWRRRALLASMTPAPFWPALAALLGCGLVWLLAGLVEVQVARQYALVAMLPLTVLAMLGPRMTAQLAFPLAFLLLAVPAGDSLVEPLMRITADFTVAALRASGIPVLPEGNNFTVPSGSWSVVEACSGLRYLVSSLTVGCLYAYLSYRSWWRRAVFILVAAVLPVLANGLRAYLIVMIAHLSDMRLAVGFDHLIYGWVFFGLVMFLLFRIGSLWREDHLPPPAAPAVAAPAPVATGRFALAACGVALCLGVWPGYAWHLQQSRVRTAPAGLDAFRAAAPEAPPLSAWQPAFSRPAAQARHAYAQQGRALGLTLLYYRDQRPDSKLISSTNRLTAMVNSPWHSAGTTLRHETLGAGRSLTLREETLDGPEGPLLFWSWYWIDGRTTASDIAGKLLQAKQTLLTGRDDGAAVFLYTPADEHGERARATLRAFLDANLGTLEATLERVRRQGGGHP